MRADLRAIAFGTSTFVVTVSPAYVDPAYVAPATDVPVVNEILFWLPYVAAFLSGLVVAKCSRHHETNNGLVTGVAISLTLGALNYFGPLVGLITDLPGAYYSMWLTIISLPVALFLVFAGIGSNGFWRKVSNDT